MGGITKILHVATFVFPDAFGGAERFIHGIARAQTASGHEVTVLTGNVGGLPAEERLDGFRMIRDPLAPVRGLRFFIDVRARVARALQRLAGERFDAWDMESVRSRFGWPATVASMDDAYWELVGAHARQ